MFIRNDIHRSEIGDHFWDAAAELPNAYEVFLFLKGA